VFSGVGGAIPLVRYAIGDSGGVRSYENLLAALRAHGFVPKAPGRRLPFVFLFGQRPHAVSFYGANVFVEMVRMGLEHPGVRELVSGKFVMEVLEDADSDRQLRIDVELARGLGPSDELSRHVASSLAWALSSASSEYGAYVPAARQLPVVRLWPHAHPEHFPVGVKHAYVRGS
jgi:phenylacetate-CoA ligase